MEKENITIDGGDKCECGHMRIDHRKDGCIYVGCNCKKFTMEVQKR